MCPGFLQTTIPNRRQNPVFKWTLHGVHFLLREQCPFSSTNAFLKIAWTGLYGSSCLGQRSRGTHQHTAVCSENCCHLWELVQGTARGVKLITHRRKEGKEKKKKKKGAVEFFAHGNFVDHLLSYIHCMIWKDSSFYLDSHQDRNSNKTLLTSDTKVTLFPQPLLNFGLSREQLNPMRFSLSNFRKRRSVHFSFGWNSAGRQRWCFNSRLCVYVKSVRDRSWGGEGDVLVTTSCRWLTGSGCSAGAVELCCYLCFLGQTTSNS